MTVGASNESASELGLLLSQANHACDVGALLSATNRIANRAAGDLASSSVSDAAFDVLENETLIDRCVEDGCLWVVSALATLESDDDPLWQTTVRLVALRVEGLGGAGIELASLFRVAQVAQKMAVHLVKAFPLNPLTRRYWAALAARWIGARESDGDALVAHIHASSDRREMVSAILEHGKLTDSWLARLTASDVDLSRLGESSEVLLELGFSERAIRRKNHALYQSNLERLPSLVVRADGRWVRIFDDAGSRWIRRDGIRSRGSSQSEVELSSVADGIKMAGVRSVVGALHASLGGGPLKRDRHTKEPSMMVVDYVWTSVRSDARREIALTATLLGIPDLSVDACLEIIAKLGPIRVGFVIADQTLLPNLVVESIAPVVTSALRSMSWVSGSHRAMLEAVDKVSIRCFVGAQVGVALEAPLTSALALGRPVAPTRSAIDEIGFDCGEIIARMTMTQRVALFAELDGLDLVPAPSSAIRKQHSHAIVRTLGGVERLRIRQAITPSLLCLIERIGLREALRRFGRAHR